MRILLSITSRIKLSINDKEENIDLINGYYNLKLKNLNNGNYTIKAILYDPLYEAINTLQFQINYKAITENTNNNTQDTSYPTKTNTIKDTNKPINTQEKITITSSSLCMSLRTW